MPSFSMNEIEEAKRRVREMQQKADSYIPPRGEAPAAPEEREHRQESRSNEAGGKNTALFGSLSDGGVVVLILLILLWGEGADNKLLFALLYLLL